MTTWIQNPFVHEFNLIVPPIKRFMAEKRVKQFFKTGSLMLSSFKRFREHPDENKKDIDEGIAVVEEKHPNAEGIHHMLAPPSYVLCAVTNHFDPTKVNWNTESGFRIHDVRAFAATLSTHVPGFQDAYFGPCDYTDAADVVAKYQAAFVPPDKFPGGPDAYINDWQKRMFKLGMEGLFSKGTKFLRECEYRFIWRASAARKGMLVVKCPEARHFCDPL